MLQGEHSATLSTFIKLPFAIKILVLSIFERIMLIYIPYGTMLNMLLTQMIILLLIQYFGQRPLSSKKTCTSISSTCTCTYSLYHHFVLVYIDKFFEMSFYTGVTVYIHNIQLNKKAICSPCFAIIQYFSCICQPL